MSPLSCPDVESRLDLYAAGECDPGEAKAIQSHLTHCPHCAAACDEARQLVGLLELRLQEPERLRRLQARITADEEPRRRVLRFPTTLRRVAALAAMVLLMAGPIGWLMQELPQVEDTGGLVIAMHEAPVRGGPDALHAQAIDVIPGRMKGSPEQPHPARERDQGIDDLPPPPAVNLELELRNTTERPMRVWVAGPLTDLRLDLHGPGARSVPAKKLPEAEPRSVPLGPGESHIVHVTSLTDGHRAWYWTKPGHYTLTAQFTTRAEIKGLGARRLIAESKPITILVEGK